LPDDRDLTTIPHRVRLRFAKRGDLRWIGHLDLVRCLERMVRRARLPIAVSQGFNPRPKIHFPAPLALGIEGRREVVELELSEPRTVEEIRSGLAAEAPEGLEFGDAEVAPSKKSGRVVSASYELAVPPERLEALRDALAHLLAQDHAIHARRRDDGPAVSVDVRAGVLAASLDESGVFAFELVIGPSGGGAAVRADEVLTVLGVADALDQGAVLTRTDLRLAPDPPTAPPPLAPTESSPVSLRSGCASP
jgi:radical SAM-linked protein